MRVETLWMGFVSYNPLHPELSRSFYHAMIQEVYNPEDDPHYTHTLIPTMLQPLKLGDINFCRLWATESVASSYNTAWIDYDKWI